MKLSLSSLFLVFFFSTTTTLLPSATTTMVAAHGMVTSPRSRNYVAHQDGLVWGYQAGTPPREYCAECLNRRRSRSHNGGLCGYSPSHDYDDWLDSVGQPVPWHSQAVYAPGSTIEVHVTLTAHHLGHFEVQACRSAEDDNNNSNSNNNYNDCQALDFVRDLLDDMPQDPAHPGRGYLSKGRNNVRMEFALPRGLVGDKVLLQVGVYLCVCVCVMLAYVMLVCVCVFLLCEV